MPPRTLAAAVAAGLSLVPFAPVANAQGGELEALKAQLAELQAKVLKLEEQQKAQAAARPETQAGAQAAVSAETQAAAGASGTAAQVRANAGDSAGRFQWKGDLRYRNETIDQEYVHSERNRDRIRARFGFLARVNDTVRVEMQAATGEALSSGGNGDARSSNQTLTDASSRKEIDLDLAYAEWAPDAQNKVTLGKMRYPWVRATGSLFYDGDINPEGLAYNWQQGGTGLFAALYYMRLAERSAAADSNMAGLQVGWRGDVASGMRLTLAASYNDHSAVQGYNAVQDANTANAFGNVVTTTGCRPGITSCIANDFNIAEGFAELAMTVGGRPLTFMVDYAKNLGDDLTGAQGELDTAYAAGVQYGRVANAHSWEVGALYQYVENDALYAQWIDSDFGGGNSGSRGPVLRAGYGFGRSFRLNATYFWNETNIDLPTTIAGVGPVTDRKYRRLQLDLNMSF